KHDGDKFFALAEWAAARFDHVNLIVSDTLQRHNIALEKNCDEAMAYQISLSIGEKWLLGNRQAIALLPSKTVIRWDHYTGHHDYNSAYEYINSIYWQNDEFRESVVKKAHEFSLRNSSAIQNMPSDALIQTSINYILEEIAVFSLMFRDEKAIDIYPGSWFKEVFDTLRRVAENDLLKGFFGTECLSIDFIRNKGVLSFAPRDAR
ncbi:MAG: tRNA-dependent cyclodipeptide synthase, partial [Alphaproteobacteria bacterium]|nr:tRNA-dependent cyclodipeptide synthase [Alphaproteobacteria bacterium]